MIKLKILYIDKQHIYRCKTSKVKIQGSAKFAPLYIYIFKNNLNSNKF